MKGFLIMFFCFFSLECLAFLYPVQRKIRTDVDITKFRYCTQDCYNHGLNQHDAHRCPQLCRH
jgi:hypothetical protein